MTGEQYLASLLELILQQQAKEKGLYVFFENTSDHIREMRVYNPTEGPISFLAWVVPPRRHVKLPIWTDGLKPLRKPMEDSS